MKLDFTFTCVARILQKLSLNLQLKSDCEWSDLYFRFVEQLTLGFSGKAIINPSLFSLVP